MSKKINVKIIVYCLLGKTHGYILNSTGQLYCGCTNTNRVSNTSRRSDPIVLIETVGFFSRIYGNYNVIAVCCNLIFTRNKTIVSIAFVLNFIFGVTININVPISLHC